MIPAKRNPSHIALKCGANQDMRRAETQRIRPTLYGKVITKQDTDNGIRRNRNFLLKMAAVSQKPITDNATPNRTANNAGTRPKDGP
jgi:hypothetical protein